MASDRLEHMATSVLPRHAKGAHGAGWREIKDMLLSRRCAVSGPSVPWRRTRGQPHASTRRGDTAQQLSCIPVDLSERCDLWLQITERMPLHKFTAYHLPQPRISNVCARIATNSAKPMHRPNSALSHFLSVEAGRQHPRGSNRPACSNIPSNICGTTSGCASPQWPTSSSPMRAACTREKKIVRPTESAEHVRRFLESGVTSTQESADEQCDALERSTNTCRSSGRYADPLAAGYNTNIGVWTELIKATLFFFLLACFFSWPRF